MTRAFDGYDPGGAWDETFDADGLPRALYRDAVSMLGLLSMGELTALHRETAASVGGPPAPIDLLPRVIDAGGWDLIERGLRQRVTALNRFLADVYGEGRAVSDGMIPRDLVWASSAYFPPAKGVAVPNDAHTAIVGVDLVRDGDGVLRVLEDNVRNPSGVSFMVETARAVGRVWGRGTDAVETYGRSLAAVLGEGAVALAPADRGAAYDEHAYVASMAGVPCVKDTERTLRDGVRTVYRRDVDGRLDRRLVDAVREGWVRLVNALGSALAGDKAVYRYVPDLVRYYLGEEPVLPQVPTYLPTLPADRRYIQANLDRLVVKRANGSGGHGMVIGRSASRTELEEVRTAIDADPCGWVAQPTIALSTMPWWTGDWFEPRHVDLRVYVLAGEGVEVVRGGLTRVAAKAGSLVVNLTQGGGRKGTWIGG